MDGWHLGTNVCTRTFRLNDAIRPFLLDDFVFHFSCLQFSSKNEVHWYGESVNRNKIKTGLNAKEKC